MRERKRKLVKITETTRGAALRRPLVPNIIWDADHPSFALYVTRTRGFWGWNYTPHGLNPETDKRWGSTRLELGDAMVMTVKEAHIALLTAKAAVKAGGDPHRAKRAQRRALTAERGNLPQTTAEALELYAKSIMASRERGEPAKRQAVHYATKAIRLLRAESLPLVSLTSGMIRVMTATMKGSQFERAHVYRAANRFLAWCRRQGLIKRNPCDDIAPDERPRRGRSRDNTPSLTILRAVWAAVEDDHTYVRDLVRFLLLVPVRREEAAGLRWSEIELDRICIGAERMKNRTPHQLALSEPALNILKSCKGNGHELVFALPDGKPFGSWAHLIDRIRRRIGQEKAGKSERFSFHDVRRSFVSTLAERGIPKEQQGAASTTIDVDLLDQCLSHTRKGVLGVYQRATRMSDKGAALRAWATYLLDEEQPASVLSFARRVDG
jgi:integrase